MVYVLVTSDCVGTSVSDCVLPTSSENITQPLRRSEDKQTLSTKYSYKVVVNRE